MFLNKEFDVDCGCLWNSIRANIKLQKYLWVSHLFGIIVILMTFLYFYLSFFFFFFKSKSTFQGISRLVLRLHSCNEGRSISKTVDLILLLSNLFSSVNGNKTLQNLIERTACRVLTSTTLHNKQAIYDSLMKMEGFQDLYKHL